MVEKKAVAVGQRVRNFSLPDQDKKPVSLTGLKGKKVLLSFHPLAWTPVCAQQMKALDKHRRAFARLGTVALGLSIDTVPSKSAWAKALKIKETRLLCDFWPHGKVAAALGLFRKVEGFSERANVILDETGRVIFVKVYPIRQLPDIAEILAFLKTAVNMVSPTSPTAGTRRRT
jgi:peroxiredoxin